ncbi:unnamed protein product, partial [Dovyalis caffra]
QTISSKTHSNVVDKALTISSSYQCFDGDPDEPTDQNEGDERQRKRSGDFMIGERKGAWLVYHWVGGGTRRKGDDPTNSHQKSPT